jgi:hypothetical protein
MLPLLWVSIAVYALAVVVRIMTVVYERQRARTNNSRMSGVRTSSDWLSATAPPYAVFDGEYRGAWLSVVTGIIQARNMTVEYVQGALTKCDEVPRQTLIGMLQNGRRHRAVSVRIQSDDRRYRGPLVSVPYENGSPHCRAEDLNVSIFIDPFDVGGWRLVLVLMTLSMAAIFIDVPGRGDTYRSRCCLFGTTELQTKWA